MIEEIGLFFCKLIQRCYSVLPYYGWASVLFTLLSKVIVFPISVLVQLNSIKVVKMYAEMNYIKAKCYGNKTMISEENYKLYRRDKYHPMMDLIPVIIQLIVLMGVVEGLKRFVISDTIFCGIDLSLYPIRAGKNMILIPITATVSARFMCWIQNRVNVFQLQQSKANNVNFHNN